MSSIGILNRTLLVGCYSDLAGPTLNRVMPRLRCYFHRPDAPSLVRDTIRARFAVGNFHLRSVLKRVNLKIYLEGKCMSPCAATLNEAP